MIEEKFFFLGNDTENPKLLLLDELSDNAEIVDLGSYLPEGVIQKIDYGNERLVITTDTRIYSGIAKLSSENTSASSVPEDSPIGTEIGELILVDPDGESAFFSTLVSGTGAEDNFLVRIDSANKLFTAGELDYETNPVLNLRIRSTDGRAIHRALR